MKKYSFKEFYLHYYYYNGISFTAILSFMYISLLIMISLFLLIFTDYNLEISRFLIAFGIWVVLNTIRFIRLYNKYKIWYQHPYNEELNKLTEDIDDINDVIILSELYFEGEEE